MDVAIRLQSISLGDDRVLFKPIGIIKGKYIKEVGIFVDEYGYEYKDMEGSDIYADRYFCCPTNIQDLRCVYSDIKKTSDVLDIFLSNFMDVCFLSYLDPVSETIKSVKFDFADIERYFANEDYDLGLDQEETVEFEVDDDKVLKFNISELNELKLCQTEEDVKTFIEKLILAGKYAKEVLSEATSSEQQKVEELKIEEPKLVLKKQESNKFNLKEMREFVFSEIVAQDEAVKRITTRILTNFMSSDYRRKSHLLVMGGTGTGKSKTIELICQYLNLPFAKVDANNYTQTGYVGRSVDEMLLKLIDAANGDIELAQKGILVIDEIDKKAPNGDNSGVSTKSVLDTLLQITGRGTVEVDIVEGRTKRTIDFDTSNLTVILTGAFEGIEKHAKTDTHKSIGFITTEEAKKEEMEITPQMLIKYGMTPELMGRIKCIVPLKKFEEEDYVKILRYSQSSPILVEKYFLETDMGIKLTYTANYLKEIARQAKEYDQGARGADVAVARSLEDIHERVLNGEPIKELKLTKRTALNNKEYYVKY